VDVIDQLDTLVDKRAKQGDAEREREEAWRASVRTYYERRRREREEAWYVFHLDQAKRIERTAASLTAEHRSEAEALSGEEFGVFDVGNRLDEEEAAGA
jgi:hypothetical protein